MCVWKCIVCQVYTTHKCATHSWTIRGTIYTCVQMAVQLQLLNTVGSWEQHNFFPHKIPLYKTLQSRTAKSYESGCRVPDIFLHSFRSNWHLRTSRNKFNQHWLSRCSWQWSLKKKRQLISNLAINMKFQIDVHRQHLWRNRLARSAVNRKVAGSSPARCESISLFFFHFPSLSNDFFFWSAAYH